MDINDLSRSFELSQQHVEDAVSPHDLVSALTKVGVQYVMIGGHTLGYFTGNPRATIDVDVIVASSHVP
ncbi:MAG: hypothetical protein ABW321_19515 [Polyangiales bacterium]